MAQTELFKKGIAELQAHNYANARKLFDENEKKQGTVAATQAALKAAQAALMKGDLEVATEKFNAVLEANPSIVECHVGLGRIAMYAGRFDDARTFGTAAIKLAPQHALGWTLLGLVHEAKGDPKSALTHLEKGAQLGDSEYLSQYNMGRFLTSENKAGQGVPYLLRAVAIDPKNSDGLIALGLAQLQLKQVPKAIESLQKATKSAPKNLDAWATLADVQFGQRDFKGALATLDAGLKAVGDQPVLLEKAVATSMMLNDPKLGIGYAERSLKVVPSYKQGWLNLAQLAMLAGDGDKSIAAARQLLTLDPTHWEAWFHLGNVYDALPDEAKAIEAYQKALKSQPNNWRVLMNLAGTLLQSSDKAKWKEAKDLLNKANGVTPAGEFRVKYNLALAHVRLNEDSKALALAKEIQQQAAPNDEMVAEAAKLEKNLLQKN